MVLAATFVATFVSGVVLTATTVLTVGFPFSGFGFGSGSGAVTTLVATALAALEALAELAELAELEGRLDEELAAELPEPDELEEELPATAEELVLELELEELVLARTTELVNNQPATINVTIVAGI